MEPSCLPAIDQALSIRRSPALVRRRARILAATGQLSAARAAWQEVAEGGDQEAQGRVRILDGRLTETDPSWLPTIGGRAERLSPVDRRRVLHITKSSVPERWSGFTIRTLQNLRAQREAGLDPKVVTEIGWPRIVGTSDVRPMVTYDGFEHYRLDRGPSYDPTRLPTDTRARDNAEAMAVVVQDLRPAILHAHSGYRGGDHALIALALRERFGIPVLYEVRGLFEAVWSTDPAAAEQSELYARRLAQETRLLRDVDGIVAISEALADDMVQRGIPREKITVVPNGIDQAALDRPVRDPALRTSLGLDGRFVVGYLGNLDHWREGIDVLIAAVAALRIQGRRDVALLIVGEGGRRGSLEAEAKRHGLGDACRFTGRVPHEAVAQYYAQMDVFANPRLDERAARFITPLKPYEAMATGIPIVVSDLPALREIVDPPRRGLVVAPGRVDELAAAVALLADDASLRGRLGDAGQAWVRSERRWTANGPRYRAAYERIVGPMD
jgi:glycosyltransferase involved in cell wall biosynthesis